MIYVSLTARREGIVIVIDDRSIQEVNVKEDEELKMSEHKTFVGHASALHLWLVRVNDGRQLPEYTVLVNKINLSNNIRYKSEIYVARRRYY